MTGRNIWTLIGYARKVMPDLVLTSDVIIGFPGETEAEAMETVDLVRQVELRRPVYLHLTPPGPARRRRSWPDPVPRAEKQKWFDLLLQDAEPRYPPGSMPRLCGPDPAGAGGRRDRRRPVAPVRPDGGGTAGAPGGQQGRPGPVPEREDHRQQHLGAVRGDGIISPIERSFALFNNVFHYHSTDTPHMRQKARVKPWRS